MISKCKNVALDQVKFYMTSGFRPNEILSGFRL